MTDPLANLLCNLWCDINPEDAESFDPVDFAQEAAWLRERVVGIDALIAGDIEGLLEAAGWKQVPPDSRVSWLARQADRGCVWLTPLAEETTMTDPLARLIEEAWNAARSGTRTFTEEAAYIRARVPGIDALIDGDRDVLLRAVGGDRLTDYDGIRAYANAWVNPHNGRALTQWQLDLAPGEEMWTFEPVAKESR